MQKFVLQFIYCFFVRTFLKIIVGVKFSNAEFLLKEKQFIIVANHNSHLDTMTLMASLPARIIDKVKPVAAADYFAKSGLQAKLSSYFINALLIQRKRDKEHPENDPINKMLEVLSKGYSLILFPEGSRGEPEQMQALKPGIGFILSQRPDVKFVPAFMKGMGNAMPKGDSLIVPYNSSLKFGEPCKVNSTNIADIMSQVEKELQKLA
jgi:1-acyl-sn-glycerol-3-phosphate acyltransferase